MGSVIALQKFLETVSSSDAAKHSTQSVCLYQSEDACKTVTIDEYFMKPVLSENDARSANGYEFYPIILFLGLSGILSCVRSN
jgi:hypothetical protein